MRPRELAAQVPGDEGWRLPVVQVEEIGPVAARDFERVAEAVGGDEPDPRALALGQGVDDDRRAVREKVDGSGVDSSLLHDIQHALLEAGRSRVGLGGAEHGLAGGLVDRERDEIGERAPDVGRDTDGTGGHGRALRDAGCIVDPRSWVRQHQPDERSSFGFRRAFTYLPYTATANAERSFCVAIAESINDLEEPDSCPERTLCCWAPSFSQ